MFLALFLVRALIYPVQPSIFLRPAPLRRPLLILCPVYHPIPRFQSPISPIPFDYSLRQKPEFGADFIRLCVPEQGWVRIDK